MAQQNLVIGISPNDNQGESLRAAMVKIESNFTELYAGGTNVTSEQIQDVVGAFVNSGTNTGITIVYDDVANTLVFTVDGVVFTTTLETKLNGIENNATADQTGAEIVTSINTELGGTTWQGGGGSSTVDVVSNVATNTILGRTTAGSGDSEELTPAQIRTLLNIADGATQNIATSGTGTALPLDNVVGYYGNMTTPNAATTYTTTGTTLGAWAKVRINAASQPTVTGATLISGATFVANTDMYMVVSYNGNIVEYYLLAI